MQIPIRADLDFIFASNRSAVSGEEVNVQHVESRGA